MKISRRHFASNAGLSVLQVIVSGVLLFFLYRYLLKQLGADQLGLWSLILASTAVARLSDLGFTGGVVKFVASYRAKNDQVRASDVVQTTVLTIAVVMAVLLFAAYPLLVYILTRIVPAQSTALALVILPWAMLAFWVNSISGVFQASLDGCQQAGYRNIVLIAGNIFFFICVISFVPQYGLIALALSQFAQAILLMIASWIMLRKFLPLLPQLPLHWSKSIFREMFTYSMNFQIAAVALLLCDPVTKILMSHYGGLSATAFYEMANQLVNKVRMLLVSANQVIVPIVAEMHETEPEKVRNVYLQSYEAVFFLALPIYALLLLLLPLISYVWIGEINKIFLTFGVILIVAYFINNVEVPAHFDSLGTGNIRWNTVAQTSMAVINVFLGTILGYFFGGSGVAMGAAIAIGLASLMVLLRVNGKYKIPVKLLIPEKHRLFAAIVFIVFSGCFFYLFRFSLSADKIIASTSIIVALFVCAVFFSILNHAYIKHAIKIIDRLMD